MSFETLICQPALSPEGNPLTECIEFTGRDRSLDLPPKNGASINVRLET
jgi:hypothetical protein